MTTPKITTVGDQIAQLVRRRELRKLDHEAAKMRLKKATEKLTEYQDARIIKEEIDAMNESIIRLSLEHGGQQVVELEP